MLFCLRLAVAAFLVGLLLRMFDVQRLGVTLASIKPYLAFTGLLMMLFNYYLKTYRWASILWIRRPDIPFGQLFRFNLISIFLGNFLPTSISADIVRIYYVSGWTADPRAAISSIFADRIIGAVSVAFATVIALLVLKKTGVMYIAPVVFNIIVALLFLSLAAVLALRNTSVPEGVKQLLDRFSGKMLFANLRDVFEHLGLYGKHVGAVGKVIAIAFLNLLVAVLEFYFIAIAFSSQVPFGYFLLFIPIVIFFSMLPLSWGGIGLVEAGLVFFFSQVGMPLETCLGIAVVYRALQLTCMLPGATFYLLDGFSVKEVSA